MFKKIIFVFAILITTLYMVPVMAEDACDGQTGAAYGLCNAYCEAMDCDSVDAQASDNACDQVYDEFFVHTGSPPPCEISCPCFTLADLQDAGTVTQCGENFSGFPDLAGAVYDNGVFACSGDNCSGTATSGPSCGLTSTGNFVTSISDVDDASCRFLILENCNTPNVSDFDQASPASDSGGTLFIDQ